MIGNLDSMSKSKITDFTVDGKCSHCGQCCGNFLMLSEAEIAKIHRYMTAHKLKEHKHLYPTSMPVSDMTCPFLDDSKEKNKCDLQDVKPAICRAFICSDTDGANKHKELYKQIRREVNMRVEFFGHGKEFGELIASFMKGELHEQV